MSGPVRKSPQSCCLQYATKAAASAEAPGTPSTNREAWRAALAILACLIPVLCGFAIPLGVLFEMAIKSGQNPFEGRYLDFVQNSLILASVAAVLTVIGTLISDILLAAADPRICCE